MSATPLPADIEFGLVVGTFIAIDSDNEDPDRLPNAVPAVGGVTFEPVKKTTSGRVPDPTTVIIQTMTTSVNSLGKIVDHQGSDGIFLPIGLWKVIFRFKGIPTASFMIEVTTAHTNESPLDLVML